MEMIEKRSSSMVRTESRCKIVQATAYNWTASLSLRRCRPTEGGMGEQQRAACCCMW
jgi:hypothetical protein